MIPRSKMKLIKAAWREGFPSRGVDPGRAKKEIDRLRERHGRMSCDLLAEHVDEKSPLAPLFEFDANKALVALRKHQASDVLGSLRVVYVDQETRSESIVPYMVVVEQPAITTRHGADNESCSIAIATHRGYVPISEARKDEQLVDQIVEQAKAELRAWEARYRHLTTYFGVRRAVQLVEKAVQQLTTPVAARRSKKK